MKPMADLVFEELAGLGKLDHPGIECASGRLLKGYPLAHLR